MFGAESDIPPLCSPGGALFSDPAGKAELLSTWFDSKQSRNIVELPQTCHPRPVWLLPYVLSEDCFCSCSKTKLSLS